MWLYTIHGFMSVVAHENDSAFLLIRFRNKETASRIRDLMIASAVSQGERFDIIDRSTPLMHTPLNDYCWRFMITKPMFENFILAPLSREIRYTNFKDAAIAAEKQRTTSTSRVKWLRDVLESLWLLTCNLDDRRHRRPWGIRKDRFEIRPGSRSRQIPPVG